LPCRPAHDRGRVQWLHRRDLRLLTRSHRLSPHLSVLAQSGRHWRDLDLLVVQRLPRDAAGLQLGRLLSGHSPLFLRFQPLHLPACRRPLVLRDGVLSVSDPELDWISEHPHPDDLQQVGELARRPDFHHTSRPVLRDHGGAGRRLTVAVQFWTWRMTPPWRTSSMKSPKRARFGSPSCDGGERGSDLSDSI
jgi:hypothetical protein